MQLRLFLLTVLCSHTAAQTTLYRYADPSTNGVGWCVRGLDDLNGDGRLEVAIASFDVECGFAGCGPATSRVSVLSGADGTPLFALPAVLSSDAVASIDVLDDIDGDGVKELVFGAPYTGAAGLLNPVGALRIHSGATGVELLRIDGPQPFSYLGSRVAGLDDFDGDGLSDVAGATWDSIRVYSSVTGLELFVLPSPALSAYQCVVERFDDFDLDGRDDFLVGFADSHPAGNGVVQVRSGVGGALLASFAPPQTEPTFGWDVRSAGDIDGDGRADLIVGTPELDLSLAASGGTGYAAVFSSTGTLLHKFDGTVVGSSLGFAVAGGGDFDGDGHADFVAASSCDFGALNCRRQTIVFSGANGSVLASVDSEFTGFAGVSVDFVGDLDGNLRSDIAFGSTCSDAFAYCGVATVFGLPAGDTYCTSGVSSGGCSATLSAAGFPSATTNSGFHIAAAGVDGQRQALVFYGVNGRQQLPWGTSSSFLCVKAPTQRTPAQNSGGTSGQCNGTLSIDWLAFVAANPGALGAPLQPGELVQAQAWYRDPPSAKSTALSNAIEFTLEP